MRPTVIALLVALSLIAVSAPTLAGGYAVVRLDEPPGDVVAGQPWRFGFMVRQHDVTPTNDVVPIVTATHRETGEEITATGRQEGAVGHFVAELTFPRAGEWKWEILPDPFAETSFETLTVVDAVGSEAPGYAASIHAGACTELGDLAFSLGEVTPRATRVKSTQMPLATGGATIDAPLPRLLDGEHAIAVGMVEGDAASVACGDIEALSGEVDAERDELVIGLQDWTDARNVGLAILRGDDERTNVRLYLLEAIPAAPAPTSADALVVEIVGDMSDAAGFEPASLTIPAGATVRWVNTTEHAHTITGDDLGFADSGVIDPGQSFSQSFSDLGTFHYRCGPHPWMEGVVVVE
jgi:plastocyanin